MSPTLVALESSGADSSGLTKAVTEISGSIEFGSRNSMSLCGRCVGLGGLQREAIGTRLSRIVLQPVTRTKSHPPRHAIPNPDGEPW